MNNDEIEYGSNYKGGKKSKKIIGNLGKKKSKKNHELENLKNTNEKDKED